MEKRRITINQIADLAFVSRSVVSRVLNNHPNVSAEARKRVLAVIEEYNYTPNANARGLATDKTREICILAPRWQNEILASSFWSLLFLGLSEQCVRRGYYASLSVIDESDPKQIEERFIAGHQFDGYILMHREVTDAVLPLLKDRNKPIVSIGHDPANLDISSVDVENFRGAYIATNHLLKLGHRDIALVIGNRSLPESVDRYNGFKQALEEAGISVNEMLVVEGEYAQSHGCEALKKLLKGATQPTAMCCMSDVMAEGVLLAAYQAQLLVPRDLAVVGFDDLPSSAYTIPPLTTVRQPIYSKGEKAANLLIDRIEGNEEQVVHVHLDPMLVVRESCGARMDDR